MLTHRPKYDRHIDINVTKRAQSIKKFEKCTQNMLKIPNVKQNIKKQSLTARIPTPSMQQPKIKKISQLINKNLCGKRQINLGNLTNQCVDKTEKRKKLDISLSRQKAERQRSISSASANKMTRLKLSVNKTQSIRKIKNFEISNEQKQQIHRIKTPRLIQDLNHKPQQHLIRRPHQERQSKQNKNIHNFDSHKLLPEKRRIKVYKK